MAEPILQPGCPEPLCDGGLIHVPQLEMWVCLFCKREVTDENEIWWWDITQDPPRRIRCLICVDAGVRSTPYLDGVATVNSVCDCRRTTGGSPPEQGAEDRPETHRGT
jgi:hypothetical protein